MNIKKRIKYLATKYSNKKIIFIGTGEFAIKIFTNYDLSVFNIVGIISLDSQKKVFLGHKLIQLSDLEKTDFDAIFVLEDFFKTLNIIEKTLENSHKKSFIKIEPFIKNNIDCSFGTKTFSKFIFLLMNPEEWISFFIKTIALSGSFYLLNKEKRKSANTRLQRFFKTQIYGNQVLRTALFVGQNFKCNGFSSVNGYTILKNNVAFNGMKISGRGMVTIGNCFHSGENCSIITQTHNYNTGTRIPYDPASVYKNVEIEDFVWLGSNVTILPGTKIGEGAIIQAGSVVHGEIPPCAIAGGNPAKVFKYRDIEHFNKLKTEKKFY